MSNIKQKADRAIKRIHEGVSRSIDLSGADIDIGDGRAPNIPTHGVFVGVPGDLKVQLAGDATPTTFVGIDAGFHPLNCVKVFDTGTTATSVKALW